MEDKKFLRIFLLSLMAFLVLYMTLIEGVNPQLTGLLNFRYFEKWTTNIEYVKFDKIGKIDGVETVILGSSTSEAYHPGDVDKIFDTKSYVLSLGGADTPTRYVFFKQAIKKFTSLKRIIYVADFFEFNKGEAKPEVAFNPEMGRELPFAAKPDHLDFIRYYFNHNLLEDAFNVIKRRKNNKLIKLGEDGSASRSMVLSSIEVKNELNSKITMKNKKRLSEYIRENYVTYSRSVLNDFTVLNPMVISLYKEMITMAQKKNVEVIFILSPYHKDFRDDLMKIKWVPERYRQWQELLREFAQAKNVKIYNATSDSLATDTMSGAWRDGIHYSRIWAYYFLEKVKTGSHYTN